MQLAGQNLSPILEMHGISKRFPGVLALDRVDFSVRRGEIHSLMGQNGAGKTTLMKILAGVYAADEGTVQLDGQLVRFRHPRDALHKGVVTVYQELSLLQNLTVAENIFLGREPGRQLTIDNKSIEKRSEEILQSLGISDIDIHARVASLPLAQRQLVEIAKALSHELKVLVLDEPTAPLTGEDTAHLFDILFRLRERGISIIFITHRLKEVLTYCDGGTVLRNGRMVGTVEIKNTTEKGLIEMMIGQEIESFYRADGHGDKKQADITIEAENLTVGDKVREVNFQIQRGEIIGITGLLGAGQNELARALFGVQNNVSGTIKRNGVPVRICSSQEAIGKGICLLTENRKEEGLVLEMSVKENVTLPSLSLFKRSKLFPFINNQKEKLSAQDIIEKVDVIMRSQNAKMRTLSGGNQQKSIVARWLLRNLDIMIFIEPTRGIDVGAKAEIYRLLSTLANDGKSIIVVSTDHTEIMGISDRIFVMYKGKLTKIFNKSEVNEERLLAEIQGGTHHE
jgi:ABC-type sugar transport system ATPase subunit